jgi:hypothetical protein
MMTRAEVGFKQEKHNGMHLGFTSWQSILKTSVDCIRDRRLWSDEFGDL